MIEQTNDVELEERIERGIKGVRVPKEEKSPRLEIGRGTNVLEETRRAAGDSPLPLPFIPPFLHFSVARGSFREGTRYEEYTKRSRRHRKKRGERNDSLHCALWYWHRVVCLLHYIYFTSFFAG